MYFLGGNREGFCVVLVVIQLKPRDPSFPLSAGANLLALSKTLKIFFLLKDLIFRCFCIVSPLFLDQ